MHNLILGPVPDSSSSYNMSLEPTIQIWIGKWTQMPNTIIGRVKYNIEGEVSHLFILSHWRMSWYFDHQRWLSDLSRCCHTWFNLLKYGITCIVWRWVDVLIIRDGFQTWVDVIIVDSTCPYMIYWSLEMTFKP